MVEVVGREVPGQSEILTPEALEFIGELCARFASRIDALLARRAEIQRCFDAGLLPSFLPETDDIRAGDWRVAEVPKALRCRTVEITGPVDPKMIINALESGADMFMAYFEDSSAPSWASMIGGQVALRAAVRRELEYTDPRTGKYYALRSAKLAGLLVRPRGLHLPEAHLRWRGRSVPASLVDFGLYMFHNAAELLRRGQGPYFYLPKLESHLEARLWNEIIVYAQAYLDIPQGSVRATVLIETLPAAFEMDEILYELRDHMAGLNCGRWDYIFSFIKTFRADPSRVLPDRAAVGMSQPFMRAYSQLLIQTCHRRGAFAMGGMAAQIPRKDDLMANALALGKVADDKAREARDGHDGTWVAHPGLISTAREAFAKVHTGANQLQRLREDVQVTARDLIAPPSGPKTLAGLRTNLRVALQYLEAWLRGRGCVPINYLMEDAATAEISRAQVWQWRRHGVVLDDGQPVTAERIREVLDEELGAVREALGEPRFVAGKFERAAELLLELTCAEQLAEFSTLAAYDDLTTLEPQQPVSLTA